MIMEQFKEKVSRLPSLWGKITSDSCTMHAKLKVENVLLEISLYTNSPPVKALQHMHNSGGCRLCVF